MRRGWRWIGMVMGVVLVGGAVMAAQGGGGSGDGRGRDWEGLLGRLASEDFAVREGATRELDQVGRGEFETLKNWIARTRDEEVKVRLFQRQETLEVEMAFDPPAISVKVENATLEEVCRALSGATGSPVNVARGSVVPPVGVRWTLDAKEKPFWEVFTALSAQHPLMYGVGPGVAWEESGTGSNGIRRGQQVGGFFVACDRALRSRGLSETGAVQSEQLVLTYRIVTDPRVQVVWHTQEFRERVEDEKGNVLFDGSLDKAPGSMEAMKAEKAGGHAYFRVLDLKVPKNGGKKIAAFTGEGRFGIGVGEQRVEKDLEKFVDAVLGTTRVRIREVTVEEGEKGMVSLTYGMEELPAVQGKTALPLPVTARVVDGAGREIWYTREPWEQKKVYRGAVTRPVKVVLTAPLRVGEVKMGFAFKDLELP